MPLVFALLASSLLHVAVVIAPGWALPEPFEADLPPTIDAVLVKAPVPPESVPVAKAPPKPPPKPSARKPRSPSTAPVVLAAQTPSDVPVVVSATPAAGEPALAVPPAPTAMDAVAEPAANITAESVVPVPANTSLPGRGHIRYVITLGQRGFIIGHAVHSWVHDGFTYRLKSLTETTGLVSVFKPAQVLQSSQGEVTAEGLKPREFRHERTGRTDTASFDWGRRIVSNGGREDSLSDGTQDMLSMYYQLVLLAPRSGVIEMPIATGRKLANYRFDVIGEETLSFPTGERQAVHITTRSGNDTIEMWLPVGEGEQSRGMPLKMRITDRKGDIYDQVADDLLSTETK